MGSVIHSTSNSTSHVDASRFPQGYIVSHSKYGVEPYEDNISSLLLLDGVQQRQITLNLIEFELPELCYDNLYIRHSGKTTGLCSKDTSDTIRIRPSDDDQIEFQFFTIQDESYEKDDMHGFLLFYRGKTTALLFC